MKKVLKPRPIKEEKKAPVVVKTLEPREAPFAVARFAEF